MFIAIIYSIQDRRSEIIDVSNDELEALNYLMNKSAQLSTDKKNIYKVNVIDKRTVHVHHHDEGYISTSVKLSHILQVLEYEGTISTN